jgi:NAD(P)-dependent dehydrogenase (short-subunit alcohol dehydrogenase family)
MVDNSIKNKVALITGAAGGLGREFALAFSKMGAKVAVADLNTEGVLETAKLIGKNALALTVNVTNEKSCREMVGKVLKKWGKIDILVNNAAIYAGLERKPFYEIEEADWDKVMNVNLKGVWQVSKAVALYMVQQFKENTLQSSPSEGWGAGGKIVNISSATVMSGSPNWSHYVTSKAGVIGLTRTMAKELGDFNITVNAVAPGFTLTDASLNLMHNAQKYGVDRGAIKRPSTAQDIVGTVLYLASSAADFVTGQTIIVDGGKQFL